MNSPNPFDVQKPIQERVNRARSRLKLSLSIVFGSSAVALLALLALQGCKREEQPTTPPAAAPDTNPPAAPVFTEPTNPPPVAESNAPAATAPGTVVLPPAAPPVVPSNPPPTEVVGETRQHTVEKGDSFYTLSKKYGVSMKAIEAANPGVNPKKLKINQKLNIPAGRSAAAASAAATGATTAAASETGEAVYTVKTGDTLARIARRHGTTVNAIKATNNLTNDRILVGQKLNVPAKAAAAPAPAATPPAPSDNTTSAPPPMAPPAVPPGR